MWFIARSCNRLFRDSRIFLQGTQAEKTPAFILEDHRGIAFIDELFANVRGIVVESTENEVRRVLLQRSQCPPLPFPASEYE
jgi:hypothetical protein